MPIIEFQNRREVALTLSVQPHDENHELPPLARAGIRYTLKEGVEDRYYSSVSEHRIEIWCDAETYEIDIVHPSPFDRLSYEICLHGGWCGGIVDGSPTVVDDLLPSTGSVTAREFAKLTVRADGWPESEPLPEKHLRWLEAKFIEHLGTDTVDVEALRPNLARPFDDAKS